MKLNAKKTSAKVNQVTNELTLKFYQSKGIEVTTSFSIEQGAKSSLLIGTALNELFTMYSNYNKAGIKLFKSSEPILFLVSKEDEVLLNVGKCNRHIQDKLKFNKSPKSMKTFAKRVNLAVNELTRVVKVVDYSEVEKAIDSISE